MAVSFYNGSTVAYNKIDVGAAVVAPPPSIGTLIGYTSNPSVFISDCSAALTGVNVTSPVYMLTSTGYTLGQVPYFSVTSGIPFYSDSNCTVPLVNLGGTVYGFNISSGVGGQGKIRIGTNYDGYEFCTSIAYGYYVTSATKVNVGNTNQCWGVNFYPTSQGGPYRGQILYSDSGGSFFGATTIAWAALPNVTATHLLTFTASNTYVNVIA